MPSHSEHRNDWRTYASSHSRPAAARYLRVSSRGFVVIVWMVLLVMTGPLGVGLWVLLGPLRRRAGESKAIAPHQYTSVADEAERWLNNR